MKVLRRSKSSRLYKIMSILIVFFLISLLSADEWLPVIGGWLFMEVTPQLHPVDVVIVHGGNTTRTVYGTELYQRGLAPRLWQLGYAYKQDLVIGDVGPSVPKQAFMFLPSTSTWSDGTAIARTIRENKLHSAIIVTDWWHSRRALCSTKQQLQGYPVQISFSPSPSPAGPDNWWRHTEIREDVLRELVKIVYYAVHYGMVPWGCS